MADDTIVVFTSDHGDLLGAHGGLIQKWCNAFDEATRVPLLIAGPGVARVDGGITVPTSHVDLIPTLLGLAGIDVEQAAAGVAAHHDEAQPLPGRDLSGVVREGRATASRGVADLLHDRGRRHPGADPGEHPHRGAVRAGRRRPSTSSRCVATLPTGPEGAQELWKLNHYYERLDDWYAGPGRCAEPVPAGRRPSPTGSCTT